MLSLSDEDKATVLALVHAHIVPNKEYHSWVPAHLVYRPAKGVHSRLPSMVQARHLGYTGPMTLRTVQIGGHYRRKALYAQCVRALKCTAKFTDISTPFSPFD